MLFSRWLIGLVIIAALVAAGQVAAAADPTGRPNVILIMVDDWGYETVAANGSTSYQTPQIDRLASEGARFERCYAQPLCTPSRVQLMTGQYNVRNYVRFGLLDDKQQTFAHWFKQAGYSTCIVGKWQLGGGFDGPKHFGFDEYCLWQLTRRPPRYANPGMEINGREVDYSAGEYGPDLVNDYLCDYIERNREQPFFAYYPMMLTHSPYDPTPDSKEYDKTVTGPENQRKIAKPKHFADMVAYTDKMIGKLVAKLDALKMRERTLILITGDNGTGKGTVSRVGDREVIGGKGQTTETGMHVPLVVNWKGTITPGIVNRDLIDFTDMAPTMLEAARLAKPEGWHLDGRSFWSQLQGQPGQPRESIYSWYAPDGGPSGVEFARGDRFKLYRNGRIFDVVQDPDEKDVLELASLKLTERQTIARLQQSLDRFKDARPAWTYEGVELKGKRKGAK